MDYKEHYKKDAELFDYFGNDQVGINEKRRNQVVFDLVNPSKNMKIADIGSGRGWFAVEMANRKCDVTAVDLSDINLSKIKEINPKVNVANGDANELPFSDEKFDWIVANEVIEHIVDPNIALNNWKQFLKPKGKILISVPYNEKIQYFLCTHCNQKTTANAHLHSFNETNLYKLVTDNEYKIVKSKKYMSKAIVLFRLNKLMCWMPQSLWNLVDGFFNRVWDKASYISIILEKK